MTTEYTAFPIVGRKTSEFPLATQLPDTTNVIFWSGVSGQNLQRIALSDFANEALKHITSALETLLDDKAITADDTFVQILDTGGVDRAITVVDGVSCFIHNSAASANLLTVAATEILPGESCFVFWNAVDAHTVIKLAASGGGGGTPFLMITNTDMTDPTYYFYGGLDSGGDWKINRYTKSSLTTKLSATELNNGSYATLSAAWAARGSLTYA